MATRDSEEFKQFVEECRKVGLADMKALEAAWDQYAEMVPETAWGQQFRELLMKMLLAGARLAKFEDEIAEGKHKE